MSSVLDAFAAEGRWYRGNLHLHTTESDGELSPPEAVELYRGAGYDFLAVTDHWRLTDPGPEARGDDFLLVPGVEINGFDPETDMIWHLVGLFPEREVTREDSRSAQWGIDALREVGADVMLAHPYWSGDLVSEILPLEGLFAMEVFNTTCERAHGRGLSVVHWDGLWHAGKRLWGTAVDDAHHGRRDGLQGWVMLKAPELTLEAVRAALLEGRFYASTGPEIHAVELSETHITVRSSPSAAVLAQSNRWMGRSAYARKELGGTGEPLTEVSLPLVEGADYVRVTVIDETGRCAWTNPIALA